MSKQVRLRRGTTTQHVSFTGADGEVTYDTTLKCLRVHDGSTPGGRAITGYLTLDLGDPDIVQEILTIVKLSSNSFLPILQVYGQAYFNQDIEVVGNVQCSRVVLALQALTYAASVAIDFQSAVGSLKTLDLTGNVVLTGSNRFFGASARVRIRSDAAIRTLTFPAGWVFVGGAAPANIAASKTAELDLFCYGTLDADVVARYFVQP